MHVQQQSCSVVNSLLITSHKPSSISSGRSRHFCSITLIFIAILLQLFIVDCSSHQLLNQQEGKNESLLHKILAPKVKHALKRHKRFSLFDEETKPGNYCSNGGKFHHGKCECRYPYAGDHCADFACVHGLSTGSRYDPDSEFFSKKCICDQHWSGELCHIPIADQCNERGSYINGRCLCQGYFFGPACQYVGKCIHGTLQMGICDCDYGYEGDYCDQIVCHHGYKDKSNHSQSCVCPERHSGFFCDECAIQDVPVHEFPNCSIIVRPSKAKITRSKTDQLIIKRILIIFLVFSLLIIFMATLCIYRWGIKRAGPSNVELQLEEIMQERQKMLNEAIFAQNGTIRRNSRYADPNRLDHDQI